MSESCSLCRIEKKLDRMLALLEANAARPAGAFAGGPLREGIQRDFPHESLRRWGCYFFALLRWAQELGARPGLADGDVAAVFAEAQMQTMPNPTPGDGRGSRIPIITNTAFVNDPVRLLNFLAGETVARRVSLWTNDPGAAAPALPVFVIRETHPQFGAHFLLSANGERWDSLPPLPGRVPAGFRALA